MFSFNDISVHWQKYCVWLKYSATWDIRPIQPRSIWDSSVFELDWTLYFYPIWWKFGFCHGSNDSTCEMLLSVECSLCMVGPSWVNCCCCWWHQTRRLDSYRQCTDVCNWLNSTTSKRNWCWMRDARCLSTVCNRACNYISISIIYIYIYINICI